MTIIIVIRVGIDIVRGGSLVEISNKINQIVHIKAKNHACDRFWENRPKRGILSFLIYSTSRLHGALGCRPPNLEAVAQAVFALRTTTLQYFC